MVWTPTDGAGPGGQFHATEAVNWLRSTNGAGVVGHTFTVSVATMTITFPAINCWVPDGSGGLTYVIYAGGTVVISASDATNPRTSIIQINSSGTVSEKAGTATAETGDVVEAPMAALDSDAIALLKVRVGAGVTTLSDSVMKGRAIDVSEANNALDGVRAQFRANRRLLGEYAPSLFGATGDAVSTGFRISTVDASDTTIPRGGEPVQQFSVATAGTGSLLLGSTAVVVPPNKNVRILVRLTFPGSSANLTVWHLGMFAAGGPATTDAGVYIRCVTTGNPFFVTRQGGAETVTDLGASYTRQTVVYGFEIETTDSGVTWVLRSQAGAVLATHTGNVPTASTNLLIGAEAVTVTGAVLWGVAYMRVEGTFS